MDLASNTIQNEAPSFVDLGLSAVNAWDEFITFGDPATRVINLMNIPHWYPQDHGFGKSTAFGMSGTRSELGYTYKTDIQNWKENKDFGRQNISMS